MSGEDQEWLDSFKKKAKKDQERSESFKNDENGLEWISE